MCSRPVWGMFASINIRCIHKHQVFFGFVRQSGGKLLAIYAASPEVLRIIGIHSVWSHDTLAEGIEVVITWDQSKKNSSRIRSQQAGMQLSNDQSHMHMAAHPLSRC